MSAHFEDEKTTVGNAAAMREALVLAHERIVETKSYYDADADKEDCEALLAAIDAALSTSPRNCDIGTPDEQYARFISFCKPRKCCDCPFGVHNFTKFESCGLAWAQMPYEKGGAE